MEKLSIVELHKHDLPFLFEMWANKEIMRYADEFPRLRGWTKSDSVEIAWERYLQQRAECSQGYIQFILLLSDETCIGESFFAPLPEGFAFGKWRKPKDVLCLMGDIKLMPAYWGQGLGTQGIQKVVAWLFDQTKCGQLVVPPHRHNPAAQRVYEKAGFVLFEGMRSWRNHKLMTLTRSQFEGAH